MRKRILFQKRVGSGTSKFIFQSEPKKGEWNSKRGMAFVHHGKEQMLLKMNFTVQKSHKIGLKPNRIRCPCARDKFSICAESGE